jgi:hypothetical protein
MTQPSMSDRGTPLDDPLPSAPPKPEQSSLLDDFMDIFYAPSKVFARREKKDFWVPLIIVTLILAGVFVANRDIFEPIMEAEFARGMAQSAQGNKLNADQIAAASKLATKFAIVGAFVGPPIAMLFMGFVLWLVGKFFDAKQTLTAAMTVAVFAWVPRIVEGVMARVQGLFVDPDSLDNRFSLSLGVGRFLDADTTSPALLGFLGRIDLFTIWVTVLLVIGLSVTGKISRSRAAIAGVVMWLAGALPALGTLFRR